MTGPIHQPGVCNIETWDGRAWRGGMNRLTETEAIKTARKWAEESGRRYRAFDIEGRVIFDSEQSGALAVLRDMKVKHDRGHSLPPIGPVIDAVDELVEAVKAGVEVRTHDGPRLHYGPVESERLAAALARVGGAA